MITKFIISTIVFAVLLKVAPQLTSGVQTLLGTIPFDEIFSAAIGLTDDTTQPQHGLIDIAEAFIWLLFISYVIIPIIAYPLKAILPFTASYRDTSQLRFIRYIGLLIALIILPYIALLLTAVMGDYIYFDENADKSFNIANVDVFFLFLRTMFSFNNENSLLFIPILGISMLLYNGIVKFAPTLTKVVDFMDSGRYGLGGSSRFANLIEELADRWQNRPKSLFLGNSLFIPWLKIGSEDERHMLTIAGTRSGKGTSSIIPNLLSWRGSMVCIDPKGENYAVTNRQRGKFGKVHAFDPFNVSSSTQDGFNPLSELDLESITLVEDIGVISEALIMSDKNGKNEHFTTSARFLVSGYIAHVISDKAIYKNPSLVDVYEIMTAPKTVQDKIHGRMMYNQNANGLPKAAATRVLDGQKSNEFQSVYATAIEQMRWINSNAMREILTRTTCSFSDMRKQPTSYYIIIPTDYLTYHKRFLRLIINAAFTAFKRGGKSPTPALFLIDEANSLGHMNQIEDGYGLDAGYGLTLWTFFQDISQITGLYGDKANSLIANSRAVQVFSVKDTETKRFVSEQLGTRTLSGALSLLRNKEAAYLREQNEIEREVSKDSGQSYIIRNGKPPLLLKRSDYYKSSYWSELADSNPDYKPKGRNKKAKLDWGFIFVMLIVGTFIVKVLYRLIF